MTIGGDVTVAIIGAGHELVDGLCRMSGICAAIQLKKKLGISSYKIFDANEDFGGTWQKNRYPGSACDAFSHLYTFSFVPNPGTLAHIANISRWRAPGAEYKIYFENVAKKYNLHKNTKFNIHVDTLEWDDKEFSWSVQYKNIKTGVETTEKFDFIILATGVLTIPHIPKELNSFSGPLVHTLNWDERIELENKIVGVIGSGQSAAQLVPAIAPMVKELHVYQRRPCWVMPELDFPYPSFVRWLFRKLPFLISIIRWFFLMFYDFLFSTLISQGICNKIGQWMLHKWMQSQLKTDATLQKLLIPKYRAFCNLVAMSDTYLKAFLRPNVKLHAGSIQGVNGQVLNSTDGTSQKLDILVDATGFKSPTFFGNLKILGQGGLDVLNNWKMDQAETYLGIMENCTPNMFFLLGPNSGAFVGATMNTEVQLAFIIRTLEQLFAKNAKAVQVKESVAKKWTVDVKKKYMHSGLGVGCNFQGLTPDDTNNVLYPGSFFPYIKETKNSNLKDIMIFST